jgi:hypothetical protein
LREILTTGRTILVFDIENRLSGTCLELHIRDPLTPITKDTTWRR